MLSKYIRKDKQFVLNFAAVVGVGLTVLTTIKSTTKACKLIDDDMTLSEKIQNTWKCYIPSGIVAASTMLCIIYSDKTTMNQKTSLINALIAVQDTHTTLKNSVNKVCDDETKEAIMKQTIRDNVPKDIYIERTEEKIFYEEYRGMHFTSTIDNVLKAEYLLNKQLSIVGKVYLNDFYDMLGISENDAGEYLGWAVDNNPCFEFEPACPWVDFKHAKALDSDELEYYYIEYGNQPEVLMRR